MKACVSSLFVLLLLLGVYTEGSAQFSWKPKPYPECRSFLVTDFGTVIRLTSTPYQVTRYFRSDTLEGVNERSLRGPVLLISDVGLMFNLNPRYAVGISHSMVADFGSDESGLYGGFKLRFRRWLNNKSSVEFTPGLLFWGHPAAGFTGGIDYRWREILGISLQFEYILWYNWDDTGGESGSTRHTRNYLGAYLGAKTGSLPGLLANAAGAVSIAVAFLILLAAFGAD